MTEPNLPIPLFVADELDRLGVDLPPDALQKLAIYLDTLLDENTRQNLTAIRDRDTAWRRHIIDSLTLLPGIDSQPDGCSIMDVGTGGGLPGMVLAIACPESKVALLESVGKKTAFLERCKTELKLDNVQVIRGRAENLAGKQPHRDGYDVVVCRAIGPLRESLEYTLPFVKVNGWLYAIKGPSVLDELDAAGDALATLGAGDIEVFDAYPDSFDHGSKIVIVAKHQPTPKGYPRAPGVPRQTPI